MSRKRSERPKRQSRERRRRPAVQAAAGPESLHSLAELNLVNRAVELPAAGHTRQLRQAALLEVQQQRGNRYAQRWLGTAGTVVQRACPPDCPRTPERPVPGLPDDVVIQVEDAIKAGSRQLAIDLVAGELVRQGRISLGDIDGGQMRYDSSMSDEGHTTQWWDKDPTRFSDAKLLPSEVRIGPSAFSSVPWLYTAIIHEWRHVQQFKTPLSMPDKDAANESDAYLHGIEQAWASGLTTDEVLELWQRLNDDHWSRLADPTVKALLQPRYDAAKAYVDSLRVSGSAPRIYHRLVFAQLFFKTGSAELDSKANDEIARIVGEVQPFRADHPDYDLRFTFTGFASPRWKHPKHGAMPAELNQALSEERAENSLAQVRNAFHAEGSGACDFRVESCLAPEMTVDDPTWDSAAGGKGAAPALAEGRDVNSDDPLDRRVDVEVEYSSGPMVPTQPPAFLGGGGS